MVPFKVERFKVRIPDPCALLALTGWMTPAYYSRGTMYVTTTETKEMNLPNTETKDTVIKMIVNPRTKR